MTTIISTNKLFIQWNGSLFNIDREFWVGGIYYEKQVWTVMPVNFSPIIMNKKNKHVSPRPQIIKKSMTYGAGNPGPGWGHTQKCGGVKAYSK